MLLKSISIMYRQKSSIFVKYSADFGKKKKK